MKLLLSSLLLISLSAYGRMGGGQTFSRSTPIIRPVPQTRIAYGGAIVAIPHAGGYHPAPIIIVHHDNDPFPSATPNLPITQQTDNGDNFALLLLFVFMIVVAILAYTDGLP